MFRRLIVTGLAFAAMLAQPAAAQLSQIDRATISAIENTLSNRLPAKALDLCEIPQSKWDAVLGDLMMGDWVMTNGVGTATEGSTQYDLTDEEVTQIEVFRQSGQGIVITGAPLPETVPLQFYKGEQWPFTVDGAVQFPGHEILYDTANTMPLDCAAGNLPRLRAQGPINLPEGVGDFDLYLYILSEQEAYGAHTMDLVAPNGQTISIARFVSFVRQ